MAAKPTLPIESEEKIIEMLPNPFVTNFIIAIHSKEDTKAHITIYNSIGIKMKSMERLNLNKGLNNITVDGSAFSKGIYMVEIRTGETKTVKKIMKM